MYAHPQCEQKRPHGSLHIAQFVRTLAQESVGCVEGVPEVLEITGNAHSLEGLERNRQDSKSGTCLNRPVQAH
jgi:hypothetical protein